MPVTLRCRADIPVGVVKHSATHHPPLPIALVPVREEVVQIVHRLQVAEPVVAGVDATRHVGEVRGNLNLRQRVVEHILVDADIGAAHDGDGAFAAARVQCGLEGVEDGVVLEAVECDVDLLDQFVHDQIVHRHIQAVAARV